MVGYPNEKQLGAEKTYFGLLLQKGYSPPGQGRHDTRDEASLAVSKIITVYSQTGSREGEPTSRPC